jgi:4-hydroxythreonine-4-phosphate dehydrogenase
MGDAAGIGPEIILKVLDKHLDEVIIYGSADVLSVYNDRFGYHYSLNLIAEPAEARDGELNVIDPTGLKLAEFSVGQLSPLCGKSAFIFRQRACDDALDNRISAIVTCPLNKEALHLAGYDYAGHTEILKELTHAERCAMLLWAQKLKTIHVSTHVSLAEAIRRVKKERIIEVTGLAQEILVKAGYENPRIAIAGLNPHAGENGLFGREEIDEIIPAVKQMKAAGLNVCGPIPPDTVFLKCAKGEYDLVVAMYHDQGHIPLKLMDFDGGVNITCGLPVIRTSVDHGTAFDIAGRNLARPDSLLRAIEIVQIMT